MLSQNHARRTYLLLTLLPLLSVLATTRAQAEVSVETTNGRARVMIVMSITDGADPVDRLRWEPLRPVAVAQCLNPQGDTRPDGLPDVGGFPSGAPAVTWAYKNPDEHDIAFARWAGTAWGPIEFLAASVEDEKDPRMFIEPDGTAHVVWWVDTNDPQVMLAHASAEIDAQTPGTWLAPARVNPLGEPARRPSVAVFGGQLRVAYERAAPTGANSPGEVVVLVQETNGTFTVEHVFPSQRVEDSAPVLHADGSRIWLDWKYSPTQFASSRFQNGAWGPVDLHDWSDTTWVGIEGLRKSIGSQVVPAVRLVILPAEPVEGGP